MSARRRRLTVAASAMLILGFAVAAWAYFTAFGSGSGDALATTLASAGPISATPSGTGALVSWNSVASPSGTAADVTFTVSRSTDASTWVAAGGTCAGTLGSATTSCTDSPASSGDYYYRVTAAFRSWTSQAQTSGTVHVTVCVTATKLAFTSSAQAFAAGSTSGVITVQRQNASGTPGTCGATTVDLSSSSGAGSFRDAGNTATITSVVIPAGSSDATFRYTDTVVGTPSVTATDHAGVLTQTSQTETVNAGTAAVIRVETAANGSGTVVPAQNVIAGSSITVYSISRDTYGNFVSNVAADTWSLPTKTGGVVDGDLVAAGDLKSATFTGHHVGTATIRAAKSGLVSTDSGTITVVAGSATQLRVETAANGSGTVVPAQNVIAGNSITVYSISRDAQGNFLANVATDASGWSLTNVTGGVVSGDLVAAADLKSASFTGHLVGSAKIHALKSGLTSTDSGTITVAAGSASAVSVVSGSPQSAVVGTQFANVLVAKVTDSSGNPLSGVSVTFAAPSSGASGTFASTGCSSNPHTYSCVAATGSNGQASSSAFAANGTAGAYNVSATAGTGSVNFSLTNLSAIGQTLLGTATDATNGSKSSSVSIASTTNGATELILVYRESQASGETISSITGPFTGIPQLVQNGTEFSKHNVYAWRAVGNGSGGTVTLTFSNSAGKNNVTVIDVIQLSNNDTSNPIVQSPAATATSATATGTLSTPAAGNAEIFLAAAGANTTLATPTNFTQIDTHAGATGTGYSFKTAFIAAAQTSTSSALGASNAWGTITLEIKHS